MYVPRGSNHIPSGQDVAPSSSFGVPLGTGVVISAVISPLLIVVIALCACCKCTDRNSRAVVDEDMQPYGKRPIAPTELPGVAKQSQLPSHEPYDEVKPSDVAHHPLIADERKPKTSKGKKFGKIFAGPKKLSKQSQQRQSPAPPSADTLPSNVGALPPRKLPPVPSSDPPKQSGSAPGGSIQSGQTLRSDQPTYSHGSGRIPNFDPTYISSTQSEDSDMYAQIPVISADPSTTARPATHQRITSIPVGSAPPAGNGQMYDNYSKSPLPQLLPGRSHNPVVTYPPIDSDFQDGSDPTYSSIGMQPRSDPSPRPRARDANDSIAVGNSDYESMPDPLYEPVPPNPEHSYSTIEDGNQQSQRVSHNRTAGEPHMVVDVAGSGSSQHIYSAIDKGNGGTDNTATSGLDSGSPLSIPEVPVKNFGATGAGLVDYLAANSVDELYNESQLSDVTSISYADTDDLDPLRREPSYRYITVREPLHMLQARLAMQRPTGVTGNEAADVEQGRDNLDQGRNNFYSTISESSEHNYYETVHSSNASASSTPPQMPYQELPSLMSQNPESDNTSRSSVNSPLDNISNVSVRPGAAHRATSKVTDQLPPRGAPMPPPSSTHVAVRQVDGPMSTSNGREKKQEGPYETIPVSVPLPVPVPEPVHPGHIYEEIGDEQNNDVNLRGFGPAMASGGVTIAVRPPVHEESLSPGRNMTNNNGADTVTSSQGYHYPQRHVMQRTHAVDNSPDPNGRSSLIGVLSHQEGGFSNGGDVRHEEVVGHTYYDYMANRLPQMGTTVISIPAAEHSMLQYTVSATSSDRNSPEKRTVRFSPHSKNSTTDLELEDPSDSDAAFDRGHHSRWSGGQLSTVMNRFTRGPLGSRGGDPKQARFVKPVKSGGYGFSRGGRGLRSRSSSAESPLRGSKSNRSRSSSSGRNSRNQRLLASPQRNPVSTSPRRPPAMTEVHNFLPDSLAAPYHYAGHTKAPSPVRHPGVDFDMFSSRERPPALTPDLRQPPYFDVEQRRNQGDIFGRKDSDFGSIGLSTTRTKSPTFSYVPSVSASPGSRPSSRLSQSAGPSPSKTYSSGMKAAHNSSLSGSDGVGVPAVSAPPGGGVLDPAMRFAPRTSGFGVSGKYFPPADDHYDVEVTGPCFCHTTPSQGPSSKDYLPSRYQPPKGPVAKIPIATATGSTLIAAPIGMISERAAKARTAPNYQMRQSAEWI